MIRVILIDDHQIVIDGLSLVVEGDQEIDLLGTFTNPLEAMSFIKGNDVDVVITDLDMDEANGEDVIAYCAGRDEEIKVIVLSMHDESAVIKHLLQLGADGYLTKSAGKLEILKAIKSVYQGVKYFTDKVLASMLNEDSSKSIAKNPELNVLSHREIEIIKLIADGLSSKIIADQLSISSRTVETHRDNIYKKLNIKGVAGIIRFAFENGIVS